MTNAIGRELPEHVDGYGRAFSFAGAFATRPTTRPHAPFLKTVRPGESKLVGDIREALEKVGSGTAWRSRFTTTSATATGWTTHCYALPPDWVHAPMVDHSEPGVAAGIDIDHPSGPVAESVSWGVLAWQIVLRTHGGSARAIECGQPKIDVAFIVASAADAYGNANGVGGPNACGSLGYAFPDAQYADRVVAVTDTPQGAATASGSTHPRGVGAGP